MGGDQGRFGSGAVMGESWEYKFFVGHGFGSRLRDSQGKDYGPLCEALLNQLGSEGWEVCSHTFSAESQPSLIVRRRSHAKNADGRRDTA